MADQAPQQTTPQYQDLNSLSDAQLDQLHNELSSGHVSDSSRAILNTLDDKSIDSLNGAYSSKFATPPNTSTPTQPIVQPSPVSVAPNSPMAAQNSVGNPFAIKTGNNTTLASTSPGLASQAKAAIGGALSVPEAFASNFNSVIAKGIGAVAPGLGSKFEQANKVIQAEQTPLTNPEDQAMHPWTSGIAKAAAASPLISALGSFAGTGVLSNVAATSLGGLAVNGGNDKIKDTLETAGISLVGQGIGSLLKPLVTSAVASQNIQNLLKPIQQKLAAATGANTDNLAAQSATNLWNAKYATAKEMYAPLNKSSQEVVNDGLIGAAQKLGDSSVLDRAQQANTLGKAVDLKQYLGANYSYFNGQDASPAMRDAYKDLSTQVQGAISSSAEKAGLKDTLQQADDFYKTQITPLRDNGIDKIASGAKDAPNFIDKFVGFNKAEGDPQGLKNLLSSMDTDGSKIVEQNLMNRALIKSTNIDNEVNYGKMAQSLLGFKRTYNDVIQPESQNTLDGMIKMLREANTAKPQGLGTVAAESIGLGGASHLAGGHPLVTGTLAAIPPSIAAIRHLAATPAGQKILSTIGESTQGREIARSIFNTMSATLPSTLSNTTSNTVGQ